MGTYLGKPVKEKHSASGTHALATGSERTSLLYAVSEMQGWRKTMEDAHITQTNLEKNYDVPTGTSIFAVFDGHAGREVSAFCAKHFVEELAELESFKAGAYREALVECFHRMDDMLRDARYRPEISEMKQMPSSPLRKVNGSKENAPTLNSSKKLSASDGKKLSVDEEAAEALDEDDSVNAASELESLKETPRTGSRAESMNLNHLKASLQEAAKTEEEEDEDEASGGEELSIQQQMKEAESKGSLSKNEAIELMLQVLKLTRKKAARSNVIRTDFDAPDEVPGDSPDINSEDDFGKYDFCTMAGCTAIVALVVNNKIYVANAGDSRGVLCDVAKLDSTLPLSFDHKPHNPIEKSRIEKAGGYVTDVGRVCGNLNLSRSIGDLKYKVNDKLHRSEQIITAEPDVTITEISDSCQFFILACDGVWDILTNEGIVDVVKSKLYSGQVREVRDLEKVVEDIFDQCISIDPMKTQGLGGDNMTCLIVLLKPVEQIVKQRNMLSNTNRK